MFFQDAIRLSLTGASSFEGLAVKFTTNICTSIDNYAVTAIAAEIL